MPAASWSFLELPGAPWSFLFFFQFIFQDGAFKLTQFIQSLTLSEYCFWVSKVAASSGMRRFSLAHSSGGFAALGHSHGCLRDVPRQLLRDKSTCLEGDANLMRFRSDCKFLSPRTTMPMVESPPQDNVLGGSSIEK